jgi:hypothetical protein
VCRRKGLAERGLDTQADVGREILTGESLTHCAVLRERGRGVCVMGGRGRGRGGRGRGRGGRGGGGGGGLSHGGGEGRRRGKGEEESRRKYLKSKYVTFESIG